MRRRTRALGHVHTPSGRAQRSGYVASLVEALGLLDRYPWHKLSPQQAHPEFRQRIFDVVVSRFEAEGEDRWDQLSKWRSVCGMPDD